MNKEGDIGGYPILQYHKKKKMANTEIPKYQSCLPSAASYYWLLLIENITHVHIITFVFQYKV